MKILQINFFVVIFELLPFANLDIENLLERYLEKLLQQLVASDLVS